MLRVKQLENPVCVYDFTKFLGEDENHEVGEIISILEKFCKKWTFQLESCPTTHSLHYQGRFSLKVKERLRIPFCDKFPGFRLGVTSNENKKNMFYVMKDESRCGGPWSDNDEKIYVPRDIRKIDELWPWQKSLLEIIKVYDERKINVVIDLNGNNGKSTFTRYCMVYKYGQLLPFCNDFKDVMRMVMDMPDSPCYLMDMPRAVNKDRLYQLYAGIEAVKGGYAYDDRYHFKQKLFDPPNIVLFTNSEPDQSLLTRDRWALWAINERRELVEYNSEPEDEIDEEVVAYLDRIAHIGLPN